MAISSKTGEDLGKIIMEDGKLYIAEEYIDMPVHRPAEALFRELFTAIASELLMHEGRQSGYNPRLKHYEGIPVELRVSSNYLEIGQGMFTIEILLPNDREISVTLSTIESARVGGHRIQGYPYLRITKRFQ